MKLVGRALALALTMTICASACPVTGSVRADGGESYYAKVYVDASGDDATADGTKGNPYATVEKAQKKVREIQNSSAYTGGDIAITFNGGTYRMGTVKIGANESGSEKGRVVYTSGDGEVARLTHSVKLDVADLTLVEDTQTLKRLPITAQGKVYVLDLSKYVDDTAYIGYGYLKNMTSANYGRRGMTRLFLNDKPQMISRWPNNGYKDLLLSDGTTSTVVNDGTPGEDGSANDVVLKFDDANMMRWTTADDMVVRGYMINAYVGASYDVKSLDTEKKRITLDNIYNKALGISDSFGLQRRWFAENLLEEIDIPTEYYIDEDARKLYYYPAYDLSESDTLELVYGRNNLPINMFEVNGASYVSFKNLNLEQVSYKAITVTNSSHIGIENCNIAYTHSNGIQINSGCTDITVQNCVIHDTAASGVYAAVNLTDEQLMAMENTGIAIQNNVIYNVGENSTYPWPAIHSDGIGDVVKNNTLYNIPVCGVEFASTDGNFEYNEIYNAVYDATDSGGMHIGGDWRRYGINVEYNYIHDLGSDDNPATLPVAGIYWDEVHSGTTQKNNFIVLNSAENKRGIFMNGGRDHTAENNVIVGANIAFQNPNTHSGYYLLSPDATFTLNPMHSGLTQTYRTLLGLYNSTDYKTSEHYKKFGSKMEEIVTDIQTYQLFSAKNLKFKGNVIADCETDTNFKTNNPLLGEQTRRFYTTEKDFKEIKIDFSSTVDTSGNYKDSEKSNTEIFVNPSIGDYRVSAAGKTALGIADEEFKLDSSFDISKIGCQNPITTGDEFKLLYPKNGGTTDRSTSVELVWESALFADEYEYTVYDPEGQVKAKGTTLDTNATVDGLTPNTSYTWEVKARYTSAIASVANSGVTEWTGVGGKYGFKTSTYEVTVENISYNSDKSVVHFNTDNVGSAKNAKLIFTEYQADGKELENCSFADIEIKSGANAQDIDMSGSGIDMTKAIIVYVWTAGGSLEPLSDKIYVK